MITHYDQSGECTPDDAQSLVDFWSQQPEVERPEWFDGSDKSYLVTTVAELLASPKIRENLS